MKIGIIGNGVVGNATARCFMEYAEVQVWDCFTAKCTHNLSDTLFCDIAFICLPEDQLDGFFSGMFQVSPAMQVGRSEANLVIKSTCPIGTTRKLAEKYGLKNLVHSPEFLTARCAVTDAQLPARNIIGFSSDWQATKTGHPLEALYANRFPGVKTFLMASDESEAVKLFQNSFFAVKVAFFNEINELAEKLGLDWETVRAAMLADGRIAHSHTQVPGPDGKYGFGGTCLPKDLNQLREAFVDNDMYSSVLSAAAIRNQKDRDRA